MFKRILIVVDQRQVSRVAIKQGVAIAAAHGAEALFFHVLPRYTVPVADMPPFVMISPEEFRRDAHAKATKLLTAAALVADKAGVTNKTATGGGEDDAHCIADAARQRRCDLIVAASEGRNALLRLLTGSVIPGLITVSPVPVLVVKESARTGSEARAAVMPKKPRRKAQAAGGAPLRRRGARA